MDKKIHERIQALQFSYDSIDSVKNVHYREINIGLGVVSSYVTRTRNLNPAFNKTTQKFIDQLLRSSAVLAEAFLKMIDLYQPDRLCLVNGRFSGYRPVMEVAIKRKVKTTVLEFVFSTTPELQRKVKFEDSLPHDIDQNLRYIEDNWSHWKGEMDRETVAAGFFERRRRGETASDKVYTRNQFCDLLPPNWDINKRNYVIFNSSEDEFFAVGETFDKYKFFKNQIEGILYLAKKTAHDPSIHYYLRIHPNLKNVKYKYHTELVTIFAKFPNMTVISADSPISTYKLIDNCEKVIVFGSTVGVEATFWGKPTILLAGALYTHLNTAYYPKSFEELDNLLFSKLEAMPRLGALKYALYIFGERGTPYKYVNYNYKVIKVGTYTMTVARCFEFKNSLIPYFFVIAFFRLLNLPKHMYFKKVAVPQLMLEK